MVALLTRPATAAPIIDEAQQQAIYDLLFSRGAMYADQVAAALKLDESDVEIVLANLAGLRVIDFDPRFGNYCTWE